MAKIDTSTPYIGIDMRDGYMGKGYAQEAVRLLIDYASKHYGVDYFIWKADKDNYASRHIAEKIRWSAYCRENSTSAERD